MEELKEKIRDVIDFPKEGVVFKDITPLLGDPEAFKKAVDALADQWADVAFDFIAGVESRGFIFASALAYKMGKGMIIVRKPGKLPYKTHSVTYDLEYGTDSLEIHEDAIAPGQKVLLVDDLLATGGTVKGTIELFKNLDASIVGVAFLIELAFLHGKEKLDGLKYTTLMTF